MSTDSMNSAHPPGAASAVSRMNVELNSSANLPGRQMLGSYKTYSEAQAIIDRLSDAEFPVERTAIVVRELAFVEQVTGRLTWPRVIARGLLSGGMVGLFIGLFFGLFLITPQAWLNTLLWAVAIGAAIGAMLDIIGYLATGGRRDFSSVGAMTAGRYEVYVDNEVAEKARHLLT